MTPRHCASGALRTGRSAQVGRPLPATVVRTAAVLVLLWCTQACGGSLPAQPSAVPISTTALNLTLEAEGGTGQGDRMTRTSASGGLTIHLSPGQRREWAITLPATPADYAVVVRYGNDETAGSETLTAMVDGAMLGSFHARDTGDNGVGWETFVTDRAGVARALAGRHVLTLESSGGDGCIEIDLITLQPTTGGI
jgi:hypothetical protein